MLNVAAEIYLLFKRSIAGITFTLLLTLFFTPIPQAGVMPPTDSVVERIEGLQQHGQEILEQAQSIQTYLDQNPLPENADQATRERYRSLMTLRNTYQERGEKLQSLTTRLSAIASQEGLTESNLRGLEGIIGQVEGEIESKSLPQPDLSRPLVGPATFPERIPERIPRAPSPVAETAIETTPLPPTTAEETREVAQPERTIAEAEETPAVTDEAQARARAAAIAFGDLEYEVEEKRRTNRRERRLERQRKMAEQRRLQEEFGDIEYEIERRQQEDTEASRQRRLQEEFGDIEYEIERRQQQERAAREEAARQETLRQRRLQEEFGDLEYVWDQSLRNGAQPARPQETPEQRRIREANEAFGDLEYEWTQSLQSDQFQPAQPAPAAPVVQEQEERQQGPQQGPAVPVAADSDQVGRSQIDPYLGTSPPYAARPGDMWVRDAQTNRWQIISEEDFIERQRQDLREEYSQALGRKLPVNKSIYVYNLNSGRENLLNASRDYEIQVIGFGPRNSIRVNVFDKDGNQLQGDFITLASNVTRGTEALAAQEALSALEKIRAAGDIQKYCRPGQVTDPDNGVIPPVDEEQQDDQGTPRPSTPVDTRGFKPGCEALADGVTPGDSDNLKRCMTSILDYVNRGANRCEQLQRMFSLKEAEQDFAGMLMTTKGESPGGLPAGSPDHLMIMKSLDNRRDAVKRIGWVTPLSIMDIAQQPLQYSMFNDWDGNGRFDAPAFLNRSGYDKLVDSFINYQTADWQPPGEIDRVTHYYSPPAMRPRNSAPWWARAPHIKSTAREITNQIRVNGRPVVNRNNSASGYHRFYTGIDGRNSYSAIRRSRGYIINKCREKAGL